MRLSSAKPSTADCAAALFSLALLITPASSMLACNNIRVDGQKFDFGQLQGPHSVVTRQKGNAPWEIFNTTYTVNICGPLIKKGGKASESCPHSARACAIKHGKRIGEDEYEVEDVISIAGDLSNYGGAASGLDEHVTRLKTSESTSDSQKEGVRITMSGGRHPLERGGKEQRAIIEMLCKKGVKGTEGEWDPTDEYEDTPIDSENVGEGASRRLRRAEGEEGDGTGDGGEDTTERQLLKENATLIFDSYGPLSDNGNVEVLRLTWHTEFACEDSQQDGGSSSSNHWGFFTWLFVLIFLGTAAYLIFGSWLNYNRYGARGWDLLPHGDTIRDIPYLLKDWTRRVMNTVQGTGSRGGYSAI